MDLCIWFTVSLLKIIFILVCSQTSRIKISDEKTEIYTLPPVTQMLPHVYIMLFCYWESVIEKRRFTQDHLKTSRDLRLKSITSTINPVFLFHISLKTQQISENNDQSVLPHQRISSCWPSNTCLWWARSYFSSEIH